MIYCHYVYKYAYIYVYITYVNNDVCNLTEQQLAYNVILFIKVFHGKLLKCLPNNYTEAGI